MRSTLPTLRGQATSPPISVWVGRGIRVGPRNGGVSAGSAPVGMGVLLVIVQDQQHDRHDTETGADAGADGRERGLSGMR